MLPTLFVSHGAPTLPLVDAPVRDFLLGLGRSIDEHYGRPRAILAVSAHWETAVPSVNAVAVNGTIHDFYGFPQPLYEISYPAPGSPELAERVCDLMGAAGFASETDHIRGLDHGAWVPARMMYPQADVPVVQLSVQSDLGPVHHLAVGLALQALRAEGILILGSGSFTHNLRGFRTNDVDAPPPPYVEVFADWMDAAIRDGRQADLLGYRKLAPEAVHNHPTEEHILPLFVAMGAAGETPVPNHLHRSSNYGILRMDAYGFA